MYRRCVSIERWRHIVHLTFAKEWRGGDLLCSKVVENASWTIAFRTSLSCSIKPVTLFIPCWTKDCVLYHPVFFNLQVCPTTIILPSIFPLLMLTDTFLISHHLLWISVINSNKSLRSPLFLCYSQGLPTQTSSCLSHCVKQDQTFNKGHRAVWSSLTSSNCIRFLPGLSHGSELVSSGLNLEKGINIKIITPTNSHRIHQIHFEFIFVRWKVQ